MTTLVDTHAHLYIKHFDRDRNEMIQRAIDGGIKQIFLPNIDSSTIEPMYQVVNDFPAHCFPMMGIHPSHIKANFKEELAQAYKELNDAPYDFCAIGEIGLDFYWDITYKEEQKQALRTQIEWAKERELPIVLHCRESFDDTLAIVQEMNDERLSGVFHCFTGNLEEAQKVADLGGFYMGIGGVVTYKKTEALSDAIQNMSLEHFVLETDSPFLTPEPHRTEDRKKNKKNKSGGRNESAYVAAVAQKIAEIKNISLEEVGEITTANANNLFKLVKKVI